ncbi:hypothetical protein LXL04_001061 [Taraxacum kok-saghyz]
MTWNKPLQVRLGMSRSTDGTGRNREDTGTGAGTEPRRGIAGRYRLGLFGDFARPEPIGSVPRNRPRNRNRAESEEEFVDETPTFNNISDESDNEDIAEALNSYKAMEKRPTHLNKTKLKQNGTRDYASQGNKVELRAFYIGTIKAIMEQMG